jgi:hypothetical protein
MWMLKNKGLFLNDFKPGAVLNGTEILFSLFVEKFKSYFQTNTFVFALFISKTKGLLIF